MKKIINCTPHTIVVDRFGTGLHTEEFPASGTVARVAASFQPDPIGVQYDVEDSAFGEVAVFSQTYGEVEGLPEPQDGVTYVVSGLVLAALAGKGRHDVVAPASGHKGVVRKDGQIVSVPGFVRN